MRVSRLTSGRRSTENSLHRPIPSMRQNGPCRQAWISRQRESQKLAPLASGCTRGFAIVVQRAPIASQSANADSRWEPAFGQGMLNTLILRSVGSNPTRRFRGPLRRRWPVPAHPADALASTATGCASDFKTVEQAKLKKTPLPSSPDRSVSGTKRLSMKKPAIRTRRPARPCFSRARTSILDRSRFGL